MALTLPKYPPEPADMLQPKSGKVSRPWLMFFQSVIDQIVTVGTAGVTGPAASIDSEIALFDGTTGKLLKRATGTGLVQATAGVYSVFTLVQNRLLGRGSASGTGTPEAITLGSGISLSGTVLSATGSGGTVTVTGTPASGNLTQFSGASSITNGNLSGDVTTAGTLAATLANTAVTPGTYGDATNVGQFTVDSKGRLTFAQNVAITGSGGGGGASFAFFMG